MVRWALLLPILTSFGSSAAAGAKPRSIAVWLDGKQVEFRSHVVSASIPALLVDGHAMLPVRFFDEELHAGLGLHLYDWGVVEVGGLFFKFALKEVRGGVPAVGGILHWSQPLPVAPRLISQRLYLPARKTLNLLGHAVRWDGPAHTLHIGLNGAPALRAPFLGPARRG